MLQQEAQEGPNESALCLELDMVLQDVMELRAQMAVSGAAALQRQGFLDAAQEILQQYRGSTGSEAAAATAEAELRIALAQACCCVLKILIFSSRSLLHQGF